MEPGRLSRDDIWNQFLRNINATNQSTDTNLQNSFNYYLGQRYQLILARLRNYKTILQYSFNVGMIANDTTASLSATISSITSSGTTATVTTTAAHGFTSNDYVTISGTRVSGGNLNVPGDSGVFNNNAGFNGTYQITVTNSTTFTYTLTSSLSGASATTSQFYPYPPGILRIEAMYITVGSVNFPMQIITSAYQWEQLNAIQIQASALPQFYFPRRDDFGIWPIPQAVYSGNISYAYRDRNLLVPDYTTGSVTLTSGSSIVVGSGTTFTSAMVGRWFVVTDTATAGEGYWYRITGFTDSTHITMQSPWGSASASPASYKVAQSPEIPAELNQCLLDGVIADFYTYVRKDLESATPYNNSFWTGDPANPSRKEGDSNIAGGIIGGVNRWSSRDDTRIIKRRPRLNPLQWKTWASSLSS